MAEYIPKDKAVEACFYGWNNNAHDCAENIRSIPAADVRPVVLCKDCKYYYKDADGYEMCDNSECYDHVTEDGFCAWAKKREES